MGAALSQWDQVMQQILRFQISKLVLLLFAFLFVGMLNSVTAPMVSAQSSYLGDEDDEEEPASKSNQAGPTIAWDTKRLARLERNVRKLERTLQRVENKANPPILIEPDAEVVALQAIVSQLSQKIEDQGQAIVQLTGQAELSQNRLKLQDEQIKALIARLDTVTKRLTMNEAKISDIADIVAPPPPPPSLGSSESDFDRAYTFLVEGKLEDAGRAFEGFIQTWPESTQRPEAWYRLGQVRSRQNDPSSALTAYANALKGWPKTSWAPEATVLMAQALFDTNRPKDACSALSQFDKLYVKISSAESRSLAKTLRVKAACLA